MADFGVKLMLIDDIEPAIGHQNIWNFYAARGLIVLQNTGQNTGQCQGTSVQGMGQLFFAVLVLITQF